MKVAEELNAWLDHFRCLDRIRDVFRIEDGEDRTLDHDVHRVVIHGCGRVRVDGPRDIVVGTINLLDDPRSHQER